MAFLASSTSSFTLTAGKVFADENHYVSAPQLAPPRLQVLTSSPRAGRGLLFLAPVGIGGRGTEIVDDHGQPIWFQPSPPGLHAMDLRVQTYRGRPVLTYWQGVTRNDVGYGTDYILNDHYRRIATVRAGNGMRADLHDFVITRHGTALITAFQPVAANLSAYGGSVHDHLLDSVIQEIDIASGKVLFQWRASQHVSPAASYRPRGKDGSSPWDYFHLNTIQVLPSGNLLISARNTHALYEINRTTGAVMWVLGGKDSDFRMGPGAQFAWQHDAVWHPNGTITMFDDEASPAVMTHSRALTLRVDRADRTVTVARSLVSPEHVLSSSEGSMQLLPHGNTLVGYGSEPYLTEFDAAGHVVFNARFLAPREHSYRAYRFRWTGRPTAPPTLAVTANGAQGWTAYASWNGATRVAAWQLLQGPTAQDLRPTATVPRRSFETRLPVAGADPGDVVEVRALDAAGRALGESRPVVVR